MCNETLKPKTTNEAIKQYMGWNASRLVCNKNQPLTIAPKALLNLFSVAADYILVVPNYLFETVICHLNEKRYAYKVSNYRGSHVIAIQYDKISA